MTESLRTQCPKCHTQYKVDLSKLSFGQTQANCTQCHHSFSIRDNIILTSLTKEEAHSKNFSDKDISEIKALSTEKIMVGKKDKRLAAKITSKKSVIKPLQFKPLPSPSLSSTVKDNPAQTISSIKNQCTSQKYSDAPPIKTQKSCDHLLSTLSNSDSDIVTKNSSNNKPLSKPITTRATTSANDTAPVNNTAPAKYAAASTTKTDATSPSIKPANKRNTSDETLSIKTKSPVKATDTDTSSDKLKVTTSLNTSKTLQKSDPLSTPENLKGPTTLNTSNPVADNGDLLFHDDMDVSETDLDESTLTGTQKSVDFEDDWDLDLNIWEDIDTDNTEQKKDSYFANNNKEDDYQTESITNPEDESWLEALIAEEDQTPVVKAQSNAKTHHQNSPVDMNNNKSSLSNLSKETEKSNGLDDLLNNLEVASEAKPIVLTPSSETAHSISQASIIQRPHKKFFEKISNYHRAEPKTASASYNQLQRSWLVSVLWFLGCLILLLLLLAQYTIFNLDNLIKDPAYKDKLERFCSIVNCTLPNADISEFSITQPTYFRNETNNKLTNILATLNNQSTQPQLLPNIKVEIYGSEGLIGDFIAEPKDYLITDHRIISNADTTSFMFTVDLNGAKIQRLNITPLY